MPLGMFAQTTALVSLLADYGSGYTLATLITSANTPEAVTAAPAPAPFTTSG